VVRTDERFSALTWMSNQDLPEAPRIAVVRSGHARDLRVLAQHVAWRLLAAGPSPALPERRWISFESTEEADAASQVLLEHGFRRENLCFWGVAAAKLSAGDRLTLEPTVGDDAWRAWAEVERPVLAEAIAPAELIEAVLDRAIAFKRLQQRGSPPIRRYVGRDEAGRPIAMIGYAPFASCNLGFADEGPLVRLRDVAVRPGCRGRGVGTALLRALAARAIEECGATAVLICGAAAGAPGALYRSVGAQPVGACVMFVASV
jgi:GNAT superfamily N-acetyltransferase